MLRRGGSVSIDLLFTVPIPCPFMDLIDTQPMNCPIFIEMDYQNSLHCYISRMGFCGLRILSANWNVPHTFTITNRDVGKYPPNVPYRQLTLRTLLTAFKMWNTTHSINVSIVINTFNVSMVLATNKNL